MVILSTNKIHRVSYKPNTERLKEKRKVFLGCSLCITGLIMNRKFHQKFLPLIAYTYKHM